MYTAIPADLIEAYAALMHWFNLSPMEISGLSIKNFNSLLNWIRRQGKDSGDGGHPGGIVADSEADPEQVARAFDRMIAQRDAANKRNKK